MPDQSLPTSSTLNVNRCVLISGIKCFSKIAVLSSWVSSGHYKQCCCENFEIHFFLFYDNFYDLGEFIWDQRVYMQISWLLFNVSQGLIVKYCVYQCEWQYVLTPVWKTHAEETFYKIPSFCFEITKAITSGKIIIIT